MGTHRIVISPPQGKRGILTVRDTVIEFFEIKIDGCLN